MDVISYMFLACVAHRVFPRVGTGRASRGAMDSPSGNASASSREAKSPTQSVVDGKAGC